MKEEIAKRLYDLNIQFAANGYVVTLPVDVEERLVTFVQSEVERENLRCQDVLARVFSELGEQGVTLEQLQQAVTIAQLPDAMAEPSI
jgi:hypothetical protein